MVPPTLLTAVNGRRRVLSPRKLSSACLIHFIAAIELLHIKIVLFFSLYSVSYFYHRLQLCGYFYG